MPKDSLVATMRDKIIDIRRQIEMGDLYRRLLQLLGSYRNANRLGVEAFILREIGGVSRKHVALLQGCSPEAVSRRVTAVKKHLRTLDEFQDL